MVRVINRACPNCGAPVPLNRGSKDVTCPFCAYAIHVEWTKPLAAPAPHTVYVAPTSRAWLAVALMGAVVPLGIISALVLGFVRPIAVGSPNDRRSIVEQVAEKSRLVPVSFPATCGLNQELEIVGATYEGTGTLIVSDINCKVRIKDSKLKGTIVVVAKNLVEITLENSTIYGTETAVRSDMNSTVRASRNSLLKSDSTGVTMGLNGKVFLEDSQIEGQEIAIKSGVNFELSAKRSTIVGKEYGIKADDNVKVEFDGSTLRGERAALRADNNLDLSSKNGTKLIGEEVGIWATANAKLELESQSKIIGKRFAVKVGHNLELSMHHATLDSDQVALCAAFNAEIAATASNLRGGLEAIRTQQKPNVLELVQTTVSGAQRFSGRSCSP